MSAASTPAPRSPSSGSSAYPRYSMFWPMLVLLAGITTFTIYQVLNLEDQLDSVTRSLDQMETNVKMGQYERTKFYSLVQDLLTLAPVDPNAEKIVTQLNLRKLQTLHPELLNQAAAASATAPSAASTNEAPVSPSSPAAK